MIFVGMYLLAEGSTIDDDCKNYLPTISLSKGNNSKSIDELTGIRFFAALHVVFFHFIYLGGEFSAALPKPFLYMVGYGESAVAFFFILSGFILTYVYTDKDHKLKVPFRTFAVARFARLYPVYILGLLLDLPRGISYFLNTYDFQAALVKIGVSLGAYITMVQAWHDRVAITWNSPAWSLSNEFFFYLVFPLLLVPIMRAKKYLLPFVILYLLPIVIYFTSAKVFHVDFNEATTAVFWRSLPAIRVTEFIIGMFLGKLFITENRFSNYIKSNAKLMGYVFWLILSVSLAFIAIRTSFPRGIFSNVFLLPCFAMMIILLATVKVPFAGIFSNKPMVLLGNASFSLYIVHQPVYEYISAMLKGFGLQHSFLFLALYLILVILFSILLYKYFESPCQRWLREKLS